MLTNIKPYSVRKQLRIREVSKISRVGIWQLKFIFITLFLSSCLLHAQERTYQFQHLSSKDGLVANVYSVIKGSEGFMWFGTSTGLYRYDGRNFKIFTYNPKDSTSLSGNRLRAPLFEDTDGSIWIGTTSNGLNRYNRRKNNFARFKHDPGESASLSNNTITRIYQDKKKDIWIGTSKGLNRFHPKSGTFTKYIQQPDSLHSDIDHIQSLFEDNKGIFYVGTTDGLFQFNRESGIFTLIEVVSQIPKNFRNIAFRDILEGENGDLWLGSNAGLFKYNTITNHLKRYYHDENDANSLLDNDVYQVLFNPTDEGETMWLCTTGGIANFYPDEERFVGFKHDPQNPHSLSDNLAWGIYIDEAGILWITNESAGVDKLNLNKNPYRYNDLIMPPPSSSHVSATSFLNDNEGNLWVGSHLSGLFRFNKEMKLTDWYNFAPDLQSAYAINFIRFLFQDSRGDIWAGTSGGGIFIYDRTANQFNHYPIKTKGSSNLIWLYRIFEDSYNTVWFTLNKGIYFRTKNSDSIVALSSVTNDPIIQTMPYSIGEDSHGNLWIGSRETGVYQLSPGNRKSLRFIHHKHNPKNPKSINDDVVLSIYNDHEGSLWIGTNQGLNKFNPHDTSFIVYDEKDGLIASKIQHIEGDKHGNLWLSTEKGLVSFNPSDLLLSRSKLYEIVDGLPISEIYPFYFYKNPDGKLFVGGRKSSIDGFFSFHPDSLLNNDHIPPIIITDFKIKNESVDLNGNVSEIKQIVLKHNENFFSLGFAALDYVNPTKNQYAYILEGLEEEWNYPGNRTFANYTGIPPGEYVFRVKGSNNHGVWNEEGTSVKIIISPPFWRTWWAYLVYAILFISALLAIRQYDLKRQQLKQELKLEHLQTEKLEELDYMKSQFFANISHEFRTPLTLILGPLKKIQQKITDDDLKKDLGIMHRNASRLHNLINQLLSLSKLESGKMKLKARDENIVFLINNFVQSFESLAKQRNISLRYKSDANNLFIYIDRDKIEKILNNLLSNAFKFTDEGDEIVVSIRSKQSSKIKRRVQEAIKGELDIQRSVLISIADTGKGISPDRIEHVFDRFYQAHDDAEMDYEGTGIGLALSKELVELHRGKIWVESIPDSWTTFTFSLPTGKEHLKPEDIVEDIVDDNEPMEEAESLLDDSKEEFMPVSDIECPEDEKHDADLPIVLIVEDNRDMRAFIRGYLDDTYRIIEAENGEIGLKQAIDNIPDLIISDVMMPRMNGIEMCTQLKSDQKTSHIPIILLTAKAGSDSKIEGLETGADAYLTKPFEAEELLVRTRKLIEQRKKLRERFAENLGTGLPSTEAGISVMDQKFLEKATEVVEQHLANSNFSVEIFGKEMAMSRVQLHRKLTALINQSASRFIRTMRLKRAAELLADKSANVSGAAYDVGFNNLSWFAKCFQEQYGISPSDFTNRRNS